MPEVKKTRRSKSKYDGKVTELRPVPVNAKNPLPAAFAENVTAEHIPAMCLCMWSYFTKGERAGIWHLKFRHTSCAADHD